ncbi:MAG: methylmalonyl Co-A mutase-associated GTPase MeaB [Candidatus Muirbacterium halophilum]|nr:methylmalonyl Co-A mutase-associated GTPase MeaB [Candidatus Muirbacterium halophilum]MCK9474550.1 methylmalonyl Co-A mutase-associated GTPase MeaB [Candidatus Muirbacterium halophilum]
MDYIRIRELSRFITQVENQDIIALEKLESLCLKNPSKSHVIGITGPPGAGKSTLTNKLISEFTKKGKVAVIAIDPSSFFSTGALLGDRVRMQEHSTNPNVFIRSLSNRNHLGGLSVSTPDIIKAFSVYNYDYIIVETVGVGQDEIDIVKFSDTVVLVLHPASGDDMQALKAGVMEIADIFVVNKADIKNEAEKTFNIINYWINLNPRKWNPPILKTQAINGEGVVELVEKINKHSDYILNNPESVRFRKEMKAKHELMAKLYLVVENLVQQKYPEFFEENSDKIIKGEIEPLMAAKNIISGVLK